MKFISSAYKPMILASQRREKFIKHIPDDNAAVRELRKYKDEK